jgi:two-component system, response regulator PdtaR
MALGHHGTQLLGMKTAPKVVIVAEDEELIRMMAAEALTDAGFVVLEAEHAADAISILEAQARGIHILFTDVHMPGDMNGLQLAHHTYGNWPWVGLIVTSGQAVISISDLPNGGRFLSKPYKLNHLLDHVQDMTGLL